MYLIGNKSDISKRQVSYKQATKVRSPANPVNIDEVNTVLMTKIYLRGGNALHQSTQCLLLNDKCTHWPLPILCQDYNNRIYKRPKTSTLRNGPPLYDPSPCVCLTDCWLNKAVHAHWWFYQDISSCSVIQHYGPLFPQRSLHLVYLGICQTCIYISEIGLAHCAFQVNLFIHEPLE